MWLTWGLNVKGKHRRTKSQWRKCISDTSHLVKSFYVVYRKNGTSEGTLMFVWGGRSSPGWRGWRVQRRARGPVALQCLGSVVQMSAALSSPPVAFWWGRPPRLWSFQAGRLTVLKAELKFTNSILTGDLLRRPHPPWQQYSSSSANLTLACGG